MIERFLDWWRDLLDPYPFVRTVLLTTRTGRVFRGVLWRRRRSFLVLRQAEQIRPDKTGPIDGEIVIDRSNVDFLQIAAPPREAS